MSVCSTRTQLYGMWFVAVVLAGVVSVQGQAMGPFNAELKEIRQCEGIETTGVFKFTTSRMTKRSKTNTTYTTHMIFKETFHRNLSVTFHFAIWGNGGYKPNSFTWESDDLCLQLWEKLPDFSLLLFKQINISTCPIPEGEYILTDIPVEYFISLKFVDAFVYGKYKVDAVIHDGDIDKGCMTFFIEVKPKKKIGKGKSGKGG